MAVDMVARMMAMGNGGVSPDDAYTKAQTDALLAGKVDKETGKGLSTNDYTNAEKTKLANLENYDDTEVKASIANVRNTAEETAQEVEDARGTYTSLGERLDDMGGGGGGGTSNYNQLTNKPSINGVTLTGNKTTSDLGIVENVQADWDEADSTAPSYIQNKPNIPSGVVVDQVYDSTSTNAQSGVAIEAKKPGEITTGKQYTIDGQTVTAGTGAEAFNDLEGNKAVGVYSHAEGSYSEASGEYSHAEGKLATASGYSSHAEGSYSEASGEYSHAEGYNTTAASQYQHVQGKFNVEDANDTYAFIIGNGTADNARHNAFAIDWNGLIYVNGSTTGVDVSQLTPVTVDQTYSASSTNAQSGTAVASAISGKISATDYATQTTGGTIKAWTTTDGSDTILHLATQ